MKRKIYSADSELIPLGRLPVPRQYQIEQNSGHGSQTDAAEFE